MSKAAYIQTIAPAAQKAVRGTGLYASVMIAQAANESNFGQSGLTRLYNNHFGIKGNSSSAAKMDTTEYRNGAMVREKASFKSYRSQDESFADYVKFLSTNRYRKAGVFSAASPEEAARALQKAGYATDPDYAAKLIAIINQYNLKQYDGLTAGVPQNNAIKPGNKAVDTNRKTITITIPMVIAVLVGLVLFSILINAE